MLIISRTKEETKALRNSHSFVSILLSEFVINQRKSGMTPILEIESLGMADNSQ